MQLMALGDSDPYCLTFTVQSLQQDAYSAATRAAMPSTGIILALPVVGLFAGGAGALMLRRRRS
ncbi:MAG: hypothetical protein WC828_04180 [Thermoleophilia bacterium]